MQPQTSGCINKESAFAKEKCSMSNPPYNRTNSLKEKELVFEGVLVGGRLASVSSVTQYPFQDRRPFWSPLRPQSFSLLTVRFDTKKSPRPSLYQKVINSLIFVIEADDGETRAITVVSLFNTGIVLVVMTGLVMNDFVTCVD